MIIGTALFVVVRIAEQLFEEEEESKPTEVDLLTEIRDELRARPRPDPRGVTPNIRSWAPARR